MKKIDESVRRAVLHFVKEGQSFNSLDIYCILGVRVNDEEYPIYEQVLDMYKNREMPSYLSEWVTIALECGSYAKVWRYYKPTIEKKSFLVNLRNDNALEVPRDALGHFPLLDEKMSISLEKDCLVLKVATGNEPYIVDTSERVRIPAKLIKEVNLCLHKELYVHVYSNKIEISGT